MPFTLPDAILSLPHRVAIWMVDTLHTAGMFLTRGELDELGYHPPTNWWATLSRAVGWAMRDLGSTIYYATGDWWH